MIDHLRPACTLLLTMTLITGVVYPVVVTGVAQILFPHQASGSLVERNGITVGSELVGQQFTDNKYFWGRLSATTPAYNAAASSGSNIGPTNPTLIENAQARMLTLRATGDTIQKVPVDLVTSSASGLDPHISPAAAAFQLQRVCKYRKLEEQAIRALIERHTSGRTWGLLGEPRVNVLLLNLDLDQLEIQHSESTQ